MRITRQLLKKCSSFPLEEVEYINLSDTDIVAIERLEACKRLQTLFLCSNQIDSIRNVYCCRQLWSIDLTGNKVKSLSGLSRYPVLGVICLGYNELDWKELKHLSHMTIVSLTLLGNDMLDSDPHYREHVIDTLPHVWMLDGRLVSAEEKKSVSQFFVQSQQSAQPVRHKVAERVFVPTSMKNLLVTGVFGEKTTHLMARFPVNYTHNAEMDRRRLSYLAYTLHQEHKLHQQHESHLPLLPSLETLIEGHSGEVEQCNMLLILLMAGLEYDLPLNLMRATLETAKLHFIGDVNCVDLLNHPAHVIIDYASLLLSAATVNREERKHVGSLYPELYRSLCVSMDSVQKKVLSQRAKLNPNVSSPKRISPEREEFHQQCHCLLASEVIHLMCLVPMFFESMDSSEGLMQLIAVATKTPKVSDIIGSIAWKVQSRGGDTWDVYHDVASYLLEATSMNVKGKRRTRKPQTVHRTTSELLQPSMPKSPGRALRALSAGAASQRLRKRPASRSATYSRSLKELELGDLVLVSGNQTARIVALPEPSLAVLQLNSKTVLSCPPDSYFYVDTGGFIWDRQMTCWITDNILTDSSHTHLSPSPPTSSITLPSSSSVEGSDHTLRTETPGLISSPHHSPIAHARPLSQISYRSDDLHTIPSLDELDEDSADEEQPTAMRVDVATANAVVPGSAHFEHRKHVLQQYSAHSLTAESPESKNQPTDPVSMEKTTPNSPEDVEQIDRDILLTVPPKVHLANTWEAFKSLPSSSQSSKLHNCHQKDSLRESAKIEPHMSPFLSQASTRPFKHLTTGTGSETRQTPSLIYDAWVVAKPQNVNVKNTLVSSSRQMSKRQPKTPPVTRRLSEARTDSRGSTHSSTTSVILHQRASQSITPTSSSSRQAYRSHSKNSTGRFHYQHPKTKSHGHGVNTRQLGDMRNLYIGGTSIG